jgi:hypothetical protein
MNMISSLETSGDYSFQSTRAAHRQALVVIACDAPKTIQQVAAVCEFFDLAVEIVPDRGDLGRLLREHRPMAIIGEIDGQHQDGFHTLMVVANYDRDLPVMLLTGGDPVLMGAADAVQEMWKLTMISRTTCAPLAGQLADFLFDSGRRAGSMRLVRV